VHPSFVKNSIVCLVMFNRNKTPHCHETSFRIRESSYAGPNLHCFERISAIMSAPSQAFYSSTTPFALHWLNRNVSGK
jgi:hypothetical protein